MIETRSGASTDVGAIRDLNQDTLLASWPVFMVADGMGGHAAGEVAAQIARDTFAGLAGQPRLRSDDVVAAVGHANSAIIQRAEHNADAAGMGTTVSGVALGEVGGVPHWIVFNVGDSRVYRFSDGHISQLTVDHSEVCELLAAGEISAVEAESHPLRNVITRSLGTEPAPVPDVWLLPVEDGDEFVVCSDGLTLELRDGEIEAILVAVSDPQDRADQLVAAAVAAGGRDNVTVVVVSLSDIGKGSSVDVTTSPRRKLNGV